MDIKYVCFCFIVREFIFLPYVLMCLKIIELILNYAMQWQFCINMLNIKFNFSYQHLRSLKEEASFTFDNLNIQYIVIMFIYYDLLDLVLPVLPQQITSFNRDNNQCEVTVNTEVLQNSIVYFIQKSITFISFVHQF